MGNWKLDTSKEFHCRQCGEFFDKDELQDGTCPNCNTDEDVFIVEEE